MSQASNPVVPIVVTQHAEDLGMLWKTRQILARSSHVELRRFARIDNRIAAHLDGCVVAGADGAVLLRAALVDPRPEAIFAIATAALEASDTPGLESVLAAAEALPETVVGLTSALGWVNRDRLAGIVKNLLGSESPFRRRLGLAACRVHGVDPGAILVSSLNDPDPGVRSEALRTAGTIGLANLLRSCTDALADSDPECQFWAAWSAVMLGDRTRALQALWQIGLAKSSHRDRAFRLALQAMTTAEAHRALQQLAGDPAHVLHLIQGSGIVGDPTYVPWLITHMTNDKVARAAGQAFSLITGADLAWLDLERKPPENFESGPNDDPDDPNVEMDPDDGLPWPDQKLVETWWKSSAARFPTGTRVFMGAPVARDHCAEILKTGYQRQRILAAHYLCLLTSGTPLFNTSAPSWRQQQLLTQMR